MPIFEYKCRKCSHSFEALLHSSKAPAPICPKCGAAKSEKQLSVFSAAMGRSGKSDACETCPSLPRRGTCSTGACPFN